MNNKEYIHFFSNCQVVIGYTRSIILDLQRSDYWYLPNDLANIICKRSAFELSEFRNLLSNSFENEEILNFIDFFLKEELAFISNYNYTASFPSLISHNDEPYDFYVVHMELGKSNMILPKSFIEESGLQNLVIEILEFPKESINDYLRNYEYTSIRCIELVLHSKNMLEPKSLENLIEEFPRINRVVVLSCEENSKSMYRDVSIERYKENKINDDIYQVKITAHLFYESLKFNPFFYKRIFIAENGDISNSRKAPVFGNLNKNNLKEIVALPENQALWNSSKENCDVCGDCEYRRVCVDSRLPKKRSFNEWYYEGDCEYNPYLCLSKGHPEYKSLFDCGVVSTNESFKIDNKRVKSLVSQIWE